MGEVASQRMVSDPGGVTVVLLGAGRVATHLAPALVRAGVRLLQVWSRTEVSARMVAEPLGVPYTNDFDAVVPDADVYIACVADGALPQVAEKVVAVAGKSSLYLHTAGSVGMELWQRCGALRYGILYPLQTFSKEREVDMREVSLFVEASDDEVLERVEGLARRLSSKVYRADSERRARLHISAVFACNFTNAMYGIAHRLLAEEDIPFEVLLPLIDETSAKVHMLTPHEAQTGPAVRGDMAVMQSHLQALAEDKELGNIYTLISNYINKHK